MTEGKSMAEAQDVFKGAIEKHLMVRDPCVLYCRHHLSQRQIKECFDINWPIAQDVAPGQYFQSPEEFVEVTKQLRQAGIPYIAMKGPALCWKMYGDLISRRYYDLDFMIPFDQLDHAATILNTMGYHTRTKIPQLHDGKEALRRNATHCIFTHQDKNTDVEIHWRLFHPIAFLNEDFNHVAGYWCMPYELLEATHLVLKNEMELLYITVHGVKHRWFRLKWLVDVSDYARNVKVDWNFFSKLVKAHRLERVVELYNTVAPHCLPRPTLLPSTANHIPRFLVTHCLKGIADEDPYQAERKKPKKPWIVISAVRVLKLLGFYWLLFPSLKDKKMAFRNIINSFFGWGQDKEYRGGARYCFSIASTIFMKLLRGRWI